MGDDFFTVDSGFLSELFELLLGTLLVLGAIVLSTFFVCISLFSCASLLGWEGVLENVFSCAGWLAGAGLCL